MRSSATPIAPIAAAVTAPARQVDVGAAAPDGLQRLILVAAALTGLSSFMYEIGWVRMLALALGSSLHAFELMLAAFIGGLAWGGWRVRGLLDDTRDPLRLVGAAQVLMGAAALATLPLYDHAFTWVGWLMRALARSDSGYVLYNVATATISMVIMLPAAFFAGMTLPAMTYVLLRRGAGERAVGRAYAANTLGAIVGVMVMVHLALPGMGLKGAMIAAAGIDLALGVVLLWLATRSGARRPVWSALALSGVALVAAITLAPFDSRRMHAGVYRSGAVALGDEEVVLFAADGKTASVAVHGEPGRSLTVSTNGKPDAGMNLDPSAPPRPDEPTMILLGLIGLAFHPEPANVANIGFGSGLTTHTLTTSTLPRAITTVEIEPRMIDAARLFGARVGGAFDDPRSKIVIDDARAYFSGQGARYDVIVSEPSNPWISGVSRMFSAEFYAFITQHLAPRGVLVQWVQAYEISDASILSLLRALDGAFVDYAIYLANETDLIIVATADGPLPAPNGRFLADVSAAKLAELAGIRGVNDLIERKLADRRLVRALLEVDGGPRHSDYFPVLAHWTPRDRFVRAQSPVVLSLDDAPMGIYTRLGLYARNSDDAWRQPPVAQPTVRRRRIAEDVAAVLLGVDPGLARTDGDRDHLWRGRAQRLRELGAGCFADAPPHVGAGLMLRLFQATAPYLAEARLRALWLERPWRRCKGPAPEPIATTEAIMSALIEDRGADLERAARIMLERHAQALDADLVPMLAHAMIYASALQDRPEAADRAQRFAEDTLRFNARGRFDLAVMRAVLDLDHR